MVSKIIIAVALAVAPLALLRSEVPKAPFTKQELECMALNVYHEARGESFKGKVLVARTVLNRVAHKDFPATICDVVYQPYQYSWTLKKRLPQPNETHYMEAIRAVYASLSDRSSALYFHATHIRPPWASQKSLLEKEGNHIFYK